MDSVHFQIHMFSINCVLWFGMEMELEGFKLSWSFIIIWRHINLLHESIGNFGFMNVHLRGVSVPMDISASDIVVVFTNLVLFTWDQWISTLLEYPLYWHNVNWRLIWEITVRWDFAPVITVNLIVPMCALMVHFFFKFVAFFNASFNWAPGNKC